MEQMIKAYTSSQSLLREYNTDEEMQKKWQINGCTFKKDYFWLVEKRNFKLYMVLFVIAFILIALAVVFPCCDLLKSILIGIGSGWLTAVVVAAFVERNANERLIRAQIEEYNNALCRVYDSIGVFSCYSLFTEFVIRNFACNSFAAEHGLDFSQGNNMEMLIEMVRDQYKNDYNEIPTAEFYCKTHTPEFYEHILDAKREVREFMQRYSSIIPEEFYIQLGSISGDINQDLWPIRLVNNKVASPKLEYFDEIIKWSREVADEDIILRHYMKY